MSDEFKKELDDVIDKLKKELDDVGKKVEEYLEKGEVYRAYKIWRDSVLDSLKILRKSLDRISEGIKGAKMSEEELRNLATYLRDSVRDVMNRIEGIGERIREARGRRGIAVWIHGPPFKHFLREVISGVDLTVDRILESVEELVENIEKSFEDIGKRLTQVVSVRIRDQDLEIIDQLVNVGIFKSRSEAIAYFARRGIESSKEWIEKALEQAKKIKELQESLRREIEEDKEEKK